MSAIEFIERSSIGAWWIKIAVIYFIFGVGLGIAMGATHDFTLRPVHAHVNLLGWVSMALFGGIYLLLPQLANTRLARIHFWLYNAAVPVACVALIFVVTGHDAFGPVAGISSAFIGIAVLAFAANVLIANFHRAGQAN